ncbi:MAG TPA: TrmH family RNA methyltransferase [Candidatus Saccharimonas sp.]|nr:TrmH family RNA methyltransferase [Candidatus Saccharimonas sp.]
MSILIIAHNIRSAYNVGSILRSADGFGVERVIFTGYTPYPAQADDTRLPHIHQKLTRQIHKTALGAEATVANSYVEDPAHAIRELKAQDVTIMALEQAPNAVLLQKVQAPQNVALLLGEEVHGIDLHLLKMCDVIAEIPMRGQKESFNVSVATGIALYQLAVVGAFSA